MSIQHETLRQALGEALTAALAEQCGDEEYNGPDWFDARNVDLLLDAVMPVLIAWNRAERAAPAEQVPAAIDVDARTKCPHYDYLAEYWHMGYDGKELSAGSDGMLTAWHNGREAAVADRAAQPATPVALKASQSTDFIRRTNEDYAAWCATKYQPEALDDRGMMSLHGLWAWQEQERRKEQAPVAPRVDAYGGVADLRDAKWLDPRCAARGACQSLVFAQGVATPVAPIDMVLHCPACGMQHIDAPEAINTGPDERGRQTPSAYTWTNPPHRSHLCQGCGHIWRPADVPTNGVAAVKTKGKADSPVTTPVAPKTLEALTEAADSMYRALEAYLREHHVGRVYTGAVAGHIAALHNALVAYGRAAR